MPHLAPALPTATHLEWAEEAPPVDPVARPALLSAAVHRAELTVPDLQSAALGRIDRDCDLDAVAVALDVLQAARSALV